MIDFLKILYILVYMKITQQTQSWGNSTGIRLPKKVLQAAKWKVGQEVIIDVKGRSVILSPSLTPKKKLPTLEELLKGVSPEKVGAEVNWGQDRGKEVIDG